MEAKFWTRLEVEFLDDDTAELKTELTYQSKRLDAIVSVPTGFVTDFASVPRLPITFALTGGKARQAAVIHDFLYQTHKVGGNLIRRRDADLTFLEAMKVTDIPAWRAELMFLGVRLGGLMSWISGPSRFKVLGNKP